MSAEDIEYQKMQAYYKAMEHNINTQAGFKICKTVLNYTLILFVLCWGDKDLLDAMIQFLTNYR